MHVSSRFKLRAHDVDGMTSVRANIEELPMRSDIAGDQLELSACQRGPVRLQELCRLGAGFKSG
jgi:hypothetical protein